MLDAGAGDGSINENDIEYIKNVFKLDSMTAEDVMTPRRSIVLVSQDTERRGNFKNNRKRGIFQNSCIFGNNG